MAIWVEMTEDFKTLLRLRTEPVPFRRLEKAEDLGKIVADDEIVIALPPGELRRAVSGMKKLAKIGFKYPIPFIGGLADPTPILAQFYPDRTKK